MKLWVVVATLGVWASVAAGEATRRTNPAHVKAMMHLKEENSRLEEELVALRRAWEEQGPAMVAEQARLAELRMKETELAAQKAAAEAETTRLRAAEAAEKTRQVEENKQIWELAVQREEQQKLASESAARTAEQEAAKAAKDAEVAALRQQAAVAEEAKAKHEATTARAEAQRWEQIRMAAEANVTAAQTAAEAQHLQTQQLEEQTRLAELAAEQAREAREAADLEVRKAELAAVTETQQQRLEQLLSEERLMRMQVEKAMREEEAAKQETLQALAQQKEAEAKHWAAQAELDSAAARAKEAEIVLEQKHQEALAADAMARAEQATAAATRAEADRAASQAEEAQARAEEAAEDARALELALGKAERELKRSEEERKEAEAVAAAKASEAEAAKSKVEQLKVELQVAIAEANSASDRRLAAVAELQTAQTSQMEISERLQAELAMEEARVKYAEAQRALAEAQQAADTSKAEQEQAVIAKQKERDEALIKRQEESSLRVEEARIAKEMEREAAKVAAETEGRIRQERENEDVKRRLLEVETQAEHAKWMAAITAITTTVGSGAHSLVNEHLERLVGALLALALGVYLSKEGIAFVRSELQRWLGQPRLVRETSRQGMLSAFFGRLWGCVTFRCCRSKRGFDGFADVVLGEKLGTAVRALARSARNAKRNRAPLRHAMFYGPPGTGKTMLAMRLARHTGLDYAIMSGGDVAPLGDTAVAEMHKLFKWAQSSNKGVLLFIDEAEAFLGRRTKNTSETLRNVLSALLYNTGTQSHKFMMVLATNRPEDLDTAITDRLDETLFFPPPELPERQRLINQYFAQYILTRGVLVDDATAAAAAHTKVGQASNQRHDKSPTAKGAGKEAVAEPKPAPPKQAPVVRAPRRRKCCSWCSWGVPPIHIMPDVDETLLEQAAVVTKGFSGRGIAKLMLAVQGTVYGRETMVLDSALFQQVLDAQVTRHNIKTKDWHECDEKVSM